MHPFNHFTPETLNEALALLHQHDDQARLIAGGTDLLLKMRVGVLAPQTIINIKRLPELQGIAFNPATGLRLGALTTLRDLIRSPIIQTHYPVLVQTAGLMASEQVRSLATVGGNLCNAAPSADLAPPLLALDTAVVLASRAGERQLPLADFFVGPGRTALNPGEMLKEILVPPVQGQIVYMRHTPRVYMDIAVVGTAVRLEQRDGVCQAARIVLGAVAPAPMRAHQAEGMLAGQPLTSTRITAVADMAAAECAPIDDVRGSAAYRRHMVRVLTRRGIEQLLSGAV